MADEGFTRLCPLCSDMCYEALPHWSWDEQEIDSLFFSSRRSHELHSQISSFHHRFQQRLPAQSRIRQCAISRFIDTVKLLWPSCQVFVYGSTATGLYLSSSDIDLLVLNSRCHNTLLALDCLARHLWRELGSDVSVLRHARVPIVRFYESQSRLNIDVRVECKSMDSPLIELQQVEMMSNSLVELPAMGPLYILLKTFLSERGLNVSFQEGGIRSYMLFVMLNTFLHLAERFMPVPYESPVFAVRLLGFLHFYGMSFNSERYGISCREAGVFRGKGFFFSKKPEVCPSGGYYPIIEHEGFDNPSWPYNLAVEDPLNPSNDLGKISHNYRTIQAAFREAYWDLISPTSKLLHSFIPYGIAEDDDLVSSFSRLRTY